MGHSTETKIPMKSFWASGTHINLSGRIICTARLWTKWSYLWQATRNLCPTLLRSSGKDGGTCSPQIIECPLMTVDELKSMPKGHFIVIKIGCHPMQTRFRQFFKKYGIQFEKAYSISEVHYADTCEVEAKIIKAYPPKFREPFPIEFGETEFFCRVNILQGHGNVKRFL